ncbi:hypothetical protein [Tistlia consotensis]|nr:hypothetical protein [Tistlia consotensis]
MLLARAVAALLVLGAASGCTRPNYPSAWTALDRPSEDCSRLQGRYLDAGERDDGAAAPSLSLLLTDREREDPAVDVVEIAVEPGPSLHVTAYREGRPVAEGHYSAAAETLDCAADGAVLEDYSGMSRGRGNPIAGYEGERKALHRAVDGSLVVERAWTTVGMIYFMFPIGGSERSWWRYPAADASLRGPAQ